MSVRIGCGAGFADDRIDPAVDLAGRGELDYLVFECLAERTIALAQRERATHPELGYNDLLEERMRAVLEPALRSGTRIVTNMGAANPLGAAGAVVGVARELGLPVRVAAVTGDDVAGVADTSGLHGVIAANAYLGIDALLPALATDAQVVVTGRVADPSLFLAPLVHEFGWESEDLLGAGTLVGHLLECAGQVTGGYFADPGVKDVPRLADLGFPLAVVEADGTAVVTKLPGTGGLVSVATVTEQLLYEVHDPAAYLTPDVTADFSGVRLAQAGPDAVAVSGARGRPRPETLKVSVAHRDGFLGVGEISYAGYHAEERVRLALEVVRERLRRFEVLDADLSVDGGRLRVAVRAADRRTADLVGREVTALWLNGPAGGGGARRSVEEVVAVAPRFVARDRVAPQVTLVSA